MICTNPTELSEITLLTYIDGEAEPEIAMHIERCPHCQQKAQALAHTQLAFTSRLFRVTCPPSLALGEFHLNLLSPQERITIAQHLVLCPHCSQELSELKTFLNQPDPVLEMGSFARLGAGIKILVADLVGGPTRSGIFGQAVASPAFAGMRGDENQPLLYQAGEVQVVIEVQADPQRPDRKALLGLITGLIEPEGVVVDLWQDNALSNRVTVDQLGNFIVNDLTPGTYELILSGAELEIHIQELSMPAS